MRELRTLMLTDFRSRFITGCNLPREKNFTHLFSAGPLVTEQSSTSHSVFNQNMTLEYGISLSAAVTLLRARRASTITYV